MRQTRNGGACGGCSPRARRWRPDSRQRRCDAGKQAGDGVESARGYTRRDQRSRRRSITLWLRCWPRMPRPLRVWPGCSTGSTASAWTAVRSGAGCCRPTESCRSGVSGAPTACKRWSTSQRSSTTSYGSRRSSRRCARGWCRSPQLEGSMPAVGRARVPGTTRIRRVLDLRPDGAPATESLLETLMVQLIRTVPGLPDPVRQLVVDSARLDQCWPDIGLFIELDGQHHRGQPVYDARRETAVVAATGWLCGRFTWTEVVRLPISTARRLAELAEQARRRPLLFRSSVAPHSWPKARALGRSG